MANSNHTPGPWHTDVSFQLRVYDSEPSGPLYNCGLIATIAETANANEDRANARLIAAAPDLLEALRFLADKINDPALVAVADAAIAKAEGKD